VGVWLFYVQHQFEETYWARGREWNFHEASLHGSSHYDLPRILRWFTANIGVHHVHHLCSGIPYYRLPQTLRDNPDLRSVGRLTLFQSFRCVRLVLWDEARRRRLDLPIHLEAELTGFRRIRPVKAAEEAGWQSRKAYPILQVAVYDAAEGVNKIIELPNR
jgi:fatty acid desaturase